MFRNLTEFPDDASLAEVFQVSIEAIPQGLKDRGPLSAWKSLSTLKTPLQGFISREAVFERIWAESLVPQESLTPGDIEFDSPPWETDFHRSFWSEKRKLELSSFLKTQPFFSGKAMIARVCSEYNEERFMGPDSVIKYRFQLIVSLDPSTCPLGRMVSLQVEYRPKLDAFVERRMLQGFIWREPTLKRAILERGLLEQSHLARHEERYQVLRNAYTLAGGASLAKHLVRSGALSTDQLVDILLETGPFIGASPEELSKAKSPTSRTSTDLRTLRWTLEDDKRIIVADPLILDQFFYMLGFEGYREVRLTNSSDFHRRWDALIPS